MKVELARRAGAKAEWKTVWYEIEHRHIFVFVFVGNTAR